MTRINHHLKADILHDFNQRMRSLNKQPKEIQQLYNFLEASLTNINEIG